MEISYADAHLEKLCRESKAATRLLGAISAKKLQLRLTELFAAENVAELVAGRPHPLTGKRSGQFALDLSGGDRLVFVPATQPAPVKPDQSIDWAKVTTITIIELGDYHE